MKRFAIISGIILLFAIIVSIMMPMSVKIYYYQTSPMRLVKADTELGPLRSKNCTVKGMKSYLEFADKAYASSTYEKYNLEALDNPELIERNRLYAAKSGLVGFRYKLIDQSKDAATIIVYYEYNRDESNKPRSKGNYYSFEGPTYKLIKGKDKWFIAEKRQLLAGAKPVIYLYPTTEQTVNVKLDFKGELACTYPDYKDGWTVKAQPDGKLVNTTDNREYSYLYWEGLYHNEWDMSKGFVVKGTETAKFLQDKLAYLGLTPKEYNEFIVYWLPVLQKNKYNLITFAGEDYEKVAPLNITPQPDSILRVMMLFKPLDEPVKVAEQELKPFYRKGFTVVEWGGTEVK